MKWENDTFGLVLRMRQMVYSSKDFESLWFLYQAEGLPKNISIGEFCTKHGVEHSVVKREVERPTLKEGRREPRRGDGRVLPSRAQAPEGLWRGGSGF